MQSMKILGAALALAFSVGSSVAHAATYKIDAKKSSLGVQTFITGVGAALGHDHYVEASEFNGTINFDPAAPDTASVNVEAKTASLRIDYPEVRKKYGSKTAPSEKDRATIEEEMRSEDQLNTAKYPTMSFASTKVTRQADGKYLVTGKLTIRGVTKEVSFPATVKTEGNTIRGEGQLKFTHTMFGWEPYSGVFGTVKNKDELLMRMDLVGVTDAPPAQPANGDAPATDGGAAPAQPAPATK